MSHQPAPKLPDAAEQRRLAALHSFGILDTDREAAFEDITRLASAICGTPIAVVNLIDRERQWFKSEIGLGARETPLDTSICAHAILEDDMLVVPDTTQDSRFASNPLVTGNPGLRFYAGALLKTTDGLPLGTVCVLDTQPRGLTEFQIDVLRGLARQVMAQLELRRLLHRAEESRRNVARLVTATGHDLKTPTRTALYAIDRARVDASDACIAKLNVARDAVMDIDRHLGNLTVAVSTGAAFAAPDIVPVALAPLLESLRTSWAAATERKRIALTVATTDARVLSNAALLETLLGNLVSNAVKYTPKDGSIAIDCHTDADGVAVSVTDTGIGIAPDRLASLFEPFRQADASSEGLGLGLWIVRQTADAIGASLQVRSTEGVGSTFTLRLDGTTTS